jgi:NADH dehydrogenase FAD-containing subunit
MPTAAEKKNIVVIGGSYVGANAVKELAQRMHATHRTLLIEKNTHFQHLFAFPRVAIVPGFERMAFIPYTRAYNDLPNGSAQVVRARATEVRPDSVVLDHGEPIPYDFLMLATGTKLAPPGTLHTADKASGMAYFQEHQQHVQRAQNIVVIGGGAVGVRASVSPHLLVPMCLLAQSSRRTSRTTTPTSVSRSCIRATA